MTIPSWLTIAIAAVVALFGLYRLRLFFHGEDKYKELRNQGMMYRIPRRSHLLMGTLFFGLGVWLIVTALGIV